MLDALGRRVINANFRLGAARHVRAVGRLAVNAEFSETLRNEAMWALLHWQDPPALDRVLGDWHPLSNRLPNVVGDSLDLEVLRSLLADSDPISAVAAELAGKYGMATMADALHRLVSDIDRAEKVRTTALDSLAKLADERVRPLARQLLTDRSPTLRLSSRQILAGLEPQTAARLWMAALEQGTLHERQVALAELAILQSPSRGTRWCGRARFVKSGDR